MGESKNSIGAFTLQRIEAKVAGGKEEPAWPGSFRILTAERRRDRTFKGSAVSVGPRVFLTAAHTLVDDGLERWLKQQRQRSFSTTLRLEGRNCKVICEVHPQYFAQPGSADVMVCHLDAAVREVFFEPSQQQEVDLDPSLVQVNESVWLTGFGLTRPGTTASGAFSTGDATIVGPHGDFAVRAAGPSNLGQGDSGGGVFSGRPDQNGRLVGIGFEIVTAANGLQSGIATLSNPATADWLVKWSARTEEKILGLQASVRPAVVVPAA